MVNRFKRMLVIKTDVAGPPTARLQSRLARFRLPANQCKVQTLPLLFAAAEARRRLQFEVAEVPPLDLESNHPPLS